eukprot:2955514-Lingulodinium_polyedra.AAC.1
MPRRRCSRLIGMPRRRCSRLIAMPRRRCSRLVAMPTVQRWTGSWPAESWSHVGRPMHRSKPLARCGSTKPPCSATPSASRLAMT